MTRRRDAATQQTAAGDAAQDLARSDEQAPPPARSAPTSTPRPPSEKADIGQLLEHLHTDGQGLTTAEAARRLGDVGPNAIVEKPRSVLAELATFVWGPIPWMIEVADLLSGILRHWDDVAIVSILLVFNAAVGFWQEHTAADAVAALKRQLALHATVRRDGRWDEVDAAALVPGDLVRITLGEIIPADVVLLDGEYLRVDQSALTGESLPVDKQHAEVAFSGSVAVQGEMTALVTDTGERTYFGKTTRLVAAAQPVSHFQRAVLAIGDYLIFLSIALVVVLVLVELFRGAKILTLVQFALILTVAAIPVAMPAVLSVTMAVGAVALAKMRAIVTRLESIEEIAGVDVLCSDKTGTLTENKLRLGDPVVIGAKDAAEVVLAGALASRAETGDAIDRAVVAGVEDKDALSRFHQDRFVPFDPVSKRTTADVTADGTSFTVTKGAPQVVTGLCHLSDKDAEAANSAVARLAAGGFRTLGVARRSRPRPPDGAPADGERAGGGVEGVATGEGTGDGDWHLLGLLSLSDPPRPDSAATIAKAKALGIEVKMLTGDNTAIAAQIAREVGLGSNIVPAATLLGDDPHEELSPAQVERVEAADGFAEVFPEHKYAIVKALQARGHIVGMTGDGVNDAPALKQADTGVAVSGATDAARAAAALVLTAPGLSVIVTAVEQARRIFERMTSYAIYRVTETIRIVLFVVAAMIVFNFYPITAILIILLALFNDLPIMTIAFDNTAVDPEPVRWDMRRVLTLSTTLGTVGVIETFFLLVLAKLWLHLDIAQIQSFIFLKLAIAGHLTLFVARARGPFLERPWPSRSVLWSAVGTKALATLLVGFGLGLVTPIAWSQIGFVWIYCLVWVFVEDWVKLAVYRHLDLSGHHHQRFLQRVQEPLDPGA
ncbi:MAG: plasma-membrane proton-efflux P-type ATPase [Acidimicrobiales bacterium]